jgi:hypothetical protein
MSSLEAVTVVTCSHLPHVRVLADSLATHDRRVRLTVVIVDDPGRPHSPEPGFDILSPLDLGIDEAELHRRALLFNAQGLISSLRPLAIRRLIDQGARSVVLLDADMLAVGSIADLWRLAQKTGILLSPHLTAPLAGRPGSWHEELYLRAGTFNGGFLGVGRDGDAGAFLDWMAARARRDCVQDLDRGLLYTQTWLNLVPGLFRHHVLTDPGVNVTAHRLDGADLGGPATRSEVDGAPLRLFHFTGFHPDAAGVLCRHLPGPRGRLDGRPRLAALCSDYADRLRAQGWPADTRYGWDALASGLPVDPTMRAVYAGSLLASERGLCDAPPDPFDRDEPQRFVDWLREPPEVSRYLLALRGSRPDLVEAFPQVPGRDTVGFLAWMGWQADQGRDGEREFPHELATARGRPSRNERRD